MAKPISNGVTLFLLGTLALGIPVLYFSLVYIPQLDILSSIILIAIIGLILGTNKRSFFGDNISTITISLGIAWFLSMFMTLSFLECLGVYAAAFGSDYLLG